MLELFLPRRGQSKSEWAPSGLPSNFSDSTSDKWKGSTCRKYSDAQVSKNIKLYVYSEYYAKMWIEITPCERLSIYKP